MEWKVFFATMLIVFIIILFQWPKMKQHPKKDKGTFLILLFIALILSSLDLQRLPGPVTWVSTLLKPLGTFMQH
ncbi:hypothetical protein [Bacillus sp. FJAT-50079]|uniref:hypothetical protein n=1 Tax=Bacillus sp. FJAT-50079 TaxID=2833577 RepID=UPI001BCA5D1B|nr:hypothetical protein [Bacillus sp. FJAT-50079]MBS4206486.1 hypothetical protein [Bacillus sp. FJAT-50079]